MRATKTGTAEPIDAAAESGFGAIAADQADSAATTWLEANVPRTTPSVALNRWSRRIGRCALLVATDVSALLASFLVAYSLWALPIHDMPLSLYAGLSPLLALFVLGYAQAGLYPGFGLGPVETLRRLSLTTLLVFVLGASFTFALKLPPIYSRMTVGLTLLLALGAVPLFRYATLATVRRWSWWPEPVVISGGRDDIRRIVARLRERPLLGYRPVGLLLEESHPVETELEGIPILGSPEQAHEVASGVRTALAVGHASGRSLEPDHLQRHFRQLLVIHDYEGLPVEGVQIRNLGGLLGIRYSNNLLEPRNRWLKRTFDMVVGSVFLLASVPVILVSAVLVKLRSPGPAFYVDERVGRRGQSCNIPKIRTMRVDARERLDVHLNGDPELLQEWNRHFKLKDDPRLIPGLGQFLRRWSLDEVPQLWSVIRGRMSLVGPRPLPEYHAARYSDAARELREQVRPGVTGLWQVSDRSDASVAEQEAADIYYVRNWSIWLDIYILGRTVGAVLSGRGAY